MVKLNTMRMTRKKTKEMKEMTIMSLLRMEIQANSFSQTFLGFIALACSRVDPRHGASG